jgi:hypothetical protein
MRLQLIGSAMIVLSVLALGLCSAAARQATQLEEHKYYSGCTCSFGYGSNPCSDAVACASEGGRCVRSCTIPQ